MLAAGGIFAKCYIAQAERSSDGTQSQKICLANLYEAYYNMRKNACLQGHFCEMLYSAGRAKLGWDAVPKDCSPNLYGAHYNMSNNACCWGHFCEMLYSAGRAQLGWDAVPKDLSHKSLLRTLYHKIPILSRVFRTKVRLFCKIHIKTSTFHKPVY